jgi:hypothetical protein
MARHERLSALPARAAAKIERRRVGRGADAFLRTLRYLDCRIRRPFEVPKGFS